MLSMYITYGRFWLDELKARFGRERGVETIEWIGLAAVILGLIGTLLAYMRGAGGKRLAEAIVDTLVKWIGDLKGGGGGE